MFRSLSNLATPFSTKISSSIDGKGGPDNKVSKFVSVLSSVNTDVNWWFKILALDLLSDSSWVVV